MLHLQAMKTRSDTDLERYLDEHKADRMASYEAFLRIPSISALPERAPSHAGDDDGRTEPLQPSRPRRQMAGAYSRPAGKG